MLVFSLLAAGVAQQPTPTTKAQPRPKHPVAAKGRATSAHLVGVNIPKTAACPVHLHFAGTITTDGPADVKYTWVSFDGGTWGTSNLNFTKAGTQKVSQEWQLGAPGQTIHGWLRLKVTSPDTLVSSKAPFNVVCAGKTRRK